MLNFIKKCGVKPGAKINLNKVDTHWNGKLKSHKLALNEIKKNLNELDSLQYLMYAENKHSLLIILQGMDAAGKDGVIRHVLTGMNPQGCNVQSFKQPTIEELNHDLLWRVHPHAPRKGSVAIFNRSHYEDVLLPRVHKLISKKQCKKRFEIINDFEKLLVTENNTIILKFFLHISKEEQLSRFGHRLKDKTRHWKISEGDYSERKFWDSYANAYEDLLSNTSTKHAPWFIIPSDHKWFRNLAISKIVADKLDSLKMKFPPSTVDITKIRKKYHKEINQQ